MRGIIAMLGGIMRWRLRGRWQWVGLGVFYVWIMAVSLFGGFNLGGFFGGYLGMWLW